MSANLALIFRETGLDPWASGPGHLVAALLAADRVEVPTEEEWRLLAEWLQAHYSAYTSGAHRLGSGQLVRTFTIFNCPTIVWYVAETIIKTHHSVDRKLQFVGLSSIKLSIESNAIKYFFWFNTFLTIRPAFV